MIASPTRTLYPPSGDRPSLPFAIALIVLATAAAYHNTLSTPFVFDDQFAIVDNPTIRDLSNLGDVLRPPPFAAGAAGRPLINLTLAINYALGGLQPWGYHALNVVLHALAALALFGLARRTWEKTSFAAEARPLALTAAILWAVHPLQTESVTCVIQRSEVLAGLLYLLTLYCFARSAESTSSGKWQTLAVISCLVGMAAKEVVVSAPLAVLLYDRTFIAGSFRATWRGRRGFYLALAGTWLVLAGLMLTSQQRGGTVGFGLGVSAWHYLLTQCRAIGIYLTLAVWPHPLVIDYGTDLVTRAAEVVPQAVALITLAIVIVVGVRRGSAAGFAGACFFAILAPSSSVVPLVTQPIAEHRMYLPLAAVVVLAVAEFRTIFGARAVWALAVLALGLGAITARRNEDYRSESSLIAGAIAANPRNDRAYLNLGTLASRENRTTDAIAAYTKALELNAGAADTHFNLAVVFERADRMTEALDHYREAVRLRPSLPNARYHLGLALARTGHIEESIAALEQALQLQPTSTAVRRSLAFAHITQGDALAQAGRLPAAIAHYESALQADPRDARTHNNLANALSQTGRSIEAIRHYEAAVAAQPDYSEAHFNLALELLAAGRKQEAQSHLTEVLRLKPEDEQARQILARLQTAEGKLK